MKIRQLELDYREAAERLIGQFAAPSPDDMWIGSGTADDSDTTILAEGSVRAVFLRNVIPNHFYKRAFDFWKLVDEPITNRPAAVGTKSLHRSQGLDGSLSPRRGVNKHAAEVLREAGAAQGILGWDAKTGGQTKLTLRHRSMLYANQDLVELAGSIYAKYVPTLYETQLAKVMTNPRAQLWETAFTNIYILKQWATACHKDTNNLPGVLTAIMACGTFSGGELLLPRWKLIISYRPGDLLLFDPQQVHGNLPFNGERLSAAFYCSRNIARCGK